MSAIDPRPKLPPPEYGTMWVSASSHSCAADWKCDPRCWNCKRVFQIEVRRERCYMYDDPDTYYQCAMSTTLRLIKCNRSSVLETLRAEDGEDSYPEIFAHGTAEFRGPDDASFRPYPRDSLEWRKAEARYRGLQLTGKVKL